MVLEYVTLPVEAEEPLPHNHSHTLKSVSVSTHSLQPYQVSSPTKNAHSKYSGLPKKRSVQGKKSAWCRPLNLDNQAGEDEQVR